MLIWLLVGIAMIVVLIAVGITMGSASRAARRRGHDEAQPAADIKIVENPPGAS